MYYLVEAQFHASEYLQFIVVWESIEEKNVSVYLCAMSDYDLYNHTF